MKLKTTLFLLLGSIGVAQAQIVAPGDIAFVGFNADGDDDVAFVTFKDIPANTNIHFCDSELTNGIFGDDENAFIWTSPATVVPAGTIISIYALSATPNPTSGTITGTPGGLSHNGDALFAFLGTSTTNPRLIGTMLAAISNSTAGFGDLTNSGLSQGTTAIMLSEGTDIAIYNGPRTGLDINGYLTQLGSISQWLEEASDADNHNNGGGTPDLPFSTTAFVISNTDNSAPTVASTVLVNETTTEVIFSEELTATSANLLDNYTFAPALAISNVVYDAALNKVIITHAALATGVAYTLSVNDIKDLANNALAQTYTSQDLYHNTLASGLLITEIMYNPPSANSNQLEFLEVYNNTANPIALGGIRVKDEGNFVFVFPEMTLVANAVVLLANDKTSADAFYGVSFLDMPQGAINALGNGGELLQILNANGAVISQVAYDDVTPWPLSPDGNGPSLELLNPNGNLNDGNNWTAAANLVGPSLGANVYASPGTYTPNVSSAVSFDTEFVFVNENAGTVAVNVFISNASATEVTATIAPLGTVGTAVEGTDYTFASQTVTFPANSSTAVTINVPVTDNAVGGADKFFVLELSNPNGATLGGIKTKVVYILDDEASAPAASETLDIDFLASYEVDPSGSAEIVAHDPVSQRLFVLNSTATKVMILDFSNPENITQISAIDMSAHGIGATSVAYKNGIVAATVEGADFGNGKVVLMDINGENVKVVEAGVLPDMVTFTHDGNKVLTANEGQPNADYSIDPEGSISVVDVSGGLSSVTQANVTTINFNAFDAQLETLKAAGVRVFGPNATVSKDFEPEYITVAEDNQTAWVTLQENNALAEINLVTNQITSIIPLGLKDHSLPGNTLDTSDQNGEIFMANWPVKGMYMPDAIASYTVSGTTYLVTANEGDVREYDALEEEAKVGDADYFLDPAVFPNAALLKKNGNLGRLVVSNKSGDLNNDGLFEEIHVFGTRSFSIWNATTKQLVYDSGDDFERITATDPVYGAIFNASNDNKNFKNRSDNKGPEPEGVTVGKIGEAFYAFVTLERIGGMMTYNITDPANPVFVSYKNNRSTTDANVGDLGPEGIIYINPTDSPNDTGLVVMANEVSATISVYKINNDVLGTGEFTPEKNTFTVYPNPVSQGMLYLSKPTDAIIYDISGRIVAQKSNASYMDVSQLSAGVYIIQPKEGNSQKFIIK
ncbi:choice-of-anchor I family protein [Flavobacterium sp. PLA-1-15]|uniref:choice-of-anchor I family protein n=1 Tax=Flavobacterium sp. PLA-1-15 TaxID=3380533 RepID=UPI003B7D709D